MAVTEPLLRAQRIMSSYNSATDSVQLLGEAAVDMAATPTEDDKGQLTSSQAQSSFTSTEGSLRKRGSSTPGSEDEFIRIEVRRRQS